MKRGNASKKSLAFLIAGVLAVSAFVKGPEQIWYLAAVFAVWGIWMLGGAMRSGLKRIGMFFDKKCAARGNKQTEFVSGEVYNPDPGGSVETVLLRHVNCRISSYLKSAYPDVTWEWCSKNPERLAAEGGTGRIRLYGVSDFNYADVVFDQLARIGCDMLRIVPLADLRGAGAPDAPKPRNGQPVDPEVWYGIQGKKILEACVADLNSRGHASLVVKENGDICARQADGEVVRDKFKNLPGKSVWQALVKVIEKQGLSAAVADDCIKVSW
ncbi:MAG: hypothetical protein LBL26_03420 [Peptococcaceae bacterium]|jgi:hypothetical protein|nr:hypothetical protein [Peptococcaceae bacterium]